MSEAFEPEILILYCRNTLGDSDCLPEGTRQHSGFRARYVMMPCSSKIETGYLIKLIEQGVDGIMVLACPPKECQFIAGSARTCHRIRHVRALLDETGMGACRVGFAYRQGLSAEDMVGLAQEQASTVMPIGRNPMKSTR